VFKHHMALCCEVPSNRPASLYSVLRSLLS